MPLQIIFMGTAELACASLQALKDQPVFSVAAVVSQPDRPKGRDLKLQPTPVKALATHLQLPVLQPERARHENFINELRALQPDLIVVAAYGQILPQTILDLPQHGCLNVHTSLLPKYRGAAPIQWAILDGESETGVTIMKMDAGLDTGDILTQTVTPIETADTSQSLHDRLARLGAELLISTIRGFVAGDIAGRKQPVEGVSYARKITKEDGRLDWSFPAKQLWNRIRAFNPWPGAWTRLTISETAATQSPLLKIWNAEINLASGSPGTILEATRGGIVVACGEGSLRITMLQKEGGRRLTTQEFLTGHPLPPGSQLG